MFKKLSAPLCLQWEVTDHCNYSCIHCYNYWNHNSNKVDKSLEKYNWDNIVKIINDNSIFHVIITGGEPLLVIKKLFPYLKAIRNLGTTISINSNVSLLDEKTAKMLKEIGVSFLVSLPCISNEINDIITNYNGAGHATINGIKILKEYKIPFTVNMVVTKLNIDYIKTTAEGLRKLGVKSFSATKASTPTNCKDFSPFRLSVEEFHKMLYDLIYIRDNYGLNISSLEAYPLCSFKDNELLKYFGNRKCTAGKITCSVGVYGDIRPCTHVSTSYGNIYEEGGFISAWNNMDNWRSNIYIPELCENCPKKFICCGGCKVEALTQTGQLTNPDPFADTSFIFDDVDSTDLDVSIDCGEIYKINDSIKYRKEDFGGIFYKSMSKWCTVSEPLYNFLLQNNNLDINTFINTFNIDQVSASKVIYNLYNKNIIRKVGE